MLFNGLFLVEGYRIQESLSGSSWTVNLKRSPRETLLDDSNVQVDCSQKEPSRVPGEGEASLDLVPVRLQDNGFSLERLQHVKVAHSVNS